MDSITVPRSVFVNGQWATAHWMADVVDESTGELVITATLAGEGGQGPVVTALRMDMDLARRLRTMAMEQTSEPGCYDCRTTGERLAVQEDRLQTLSDTMRRIVAEIDQRLDALEALLEETTDLVGTLSARQRNDEVAFGDRLSEIERRLATIERRQEEDAATFGQHARRLDGIDEELGDQTQRLSALEERVSEVERLLKEMSNREQIDLSQFLGLAKQVDALEVKAASAAVHLGQVPNVVKRINELDHLVQAVIKDCVAIENRLEAQEERLASSLEVHDARD